MLALPDEIILDIFERHVPNFRRVLVLYGISLVCKRLHRLALSAIYRRVRLRSNALLHLFLRSIVENPELSNLVVELQLELMPNIGNPSSVHILERYLRNGQSYLITPSKDELQRLCDHAKLRGLDDELVESLRINDKTSLQVKAILLLMLLPGLSSFHLEQDRPNELFDSLFLKATQEGKLLPKLTEFKREYKDYQNKYTRDQSPVIVTNIVPTMLAPSMQVITAVNGFIGHNGREYQEFVSRSRLRFYYGTSSVQTLNLRNCRIDGEELDLLLMFPKSLHTLYLEPCSSFSSSSITSHFDSIKKALKNVSNTLVRLHIAKSNWKMESYQPSELFRGLKELKQLAIPPELLLEGGSGPMGDVETFFPSTLDELTIILDYYPTPHKRIMSLDLVEEMVKLKSKGKSAITKIGLDEWRPEDVIRVMDLYTSALEAGITVANVEKRERPFEYSKLTLVGTVAKGTEFRRIP